jgi:hypothetical protein
MSLLPGYPLGSGSSASRRCCSNRATFGELEISGIGKLSNAVVKDKYQLLTEPNS